MPSRKKSRKKSRQRKSRSSTRSRNKKFVMFTSKERKEIRKHYFEVVDPKSKCTEFTLSKVLKAASGMYIYPHPIPTNKGIERLCYELVESYQKAQEPIVHEDSITSWGNQAAEQYGLEVRDILKMKPGDQMKVILLDRNVGDYLHGNKKGKKFNPKENGFSYATYIHKEGLSGILHFDHGPTHEYFQWEINRDSLKEKKYRIFWGPIPEKLSPKKLNPKIKVGWRGPAIDVKDTKYLPKSFVHYDTWWDDYLPFRTHDFLKVKRLKK